MAPGYIMALDQGTTVSRCLIFDDSGSVVSRAEAGLEQIYPRPGWVEHDPAAIWQSQRAAAAEAMAVGGIGAAGIRAIGIANQRETTVVWDRASGKPVHNAIVWQCRRSAGLCAELRAAGHGAMVAEKTGLRIDPYFSAGKLQWILDNVPGARDRARAGDLLFGTVDSWLLWNLTGGRVHATDFTNASRTMLFNIHTLDWDRELLDLFGVPRAMLPEALPSRYGFGTAESGIFGSAIPIAGMAGDQQAALFGQLCTGAGCAKNTYGTGCFLLLHTGATPVRSRSDLITTIVATADRSLEYALEGSIFSAGDILLWLRDEVGVIRDFATLDGLARSVDDNGGVHIVPAFSGLGAPYWNPRARGTITGLGHRTGRAHLARAALESIAHQTVDVLRAMERDAGTRVRVLKADGGVSANNFLMQFQADLLDLEVVRPEMIDTTALGAALLAGLEVGMWRDMDEIRSLCGDVTMFSSAMRETTRAKLFDAWRRAVDTALYWAR